MIKQDSAPKIVVITDSTKTTGLGRYANTLSNSLGAHLISLRKDKTKLKDKFNGTVIDGKFPPLLKTGWYFNQFYPSIFMSRFKNYISANIGPQDIMHYSSQTLVPLKNKCKKVVTIHDLFAINLKYDYNKVFAKAVEKSLSRAKLFDNVITDSDHIKRQLIEEGFTRNVETIYPPVDRSFMPLPNKELIRKTLSLPLDKKLVLSVASNDPRKNLQVIKPTLEILGSDYALVRVGDAIGDCISFKNIDDQKLNSIYNACDILLFPSLDEGFGLPVAEAMSVGLPVVASDIEIFREIAGDAAVLSEPVPIHLASAVKEAINSKEFLTNKGFLIAKQYGFEAFKKKIRTYYKDRFGVPIDDN